MASRPTVRSGVGPEPERPARGLLSPETVLTLQRTAGNAAFAKWAATPLAGPATTCCPSCDPAGVRDESPPAGDTAAIVVAGGSGQETETASPTTSASPPMSVPNPACNSVSGTFNLPSGTLPATLSGTKLGASWSMSADFTSDPPDPAVCGPCGEYRQYVRGTFTKNGATVRHRLCGTDLDPNSYQEDCVMAGGRAFKYGYHSIPDGNSRFSNPDQATGQRWDGYDAPGISGASGDTLGVDLHFYGDIVDVCNGATLGGSSWSVQGTATVP